MFRQGADLTGKLTCTGNGKKLEGGQACPVQKLRENRRLKNAALVASLKEDSHSAELYKMACADAKLKRMTYPRPLRKSDLEKYTLSPRFCVEQGLRFICASITYIRLG